MTTPNSPDPRDPNAPRDPNTGAGADEPKYGQRLPQAPQYGQQDQGQPYTPYGQQGPAGPAGQQPSPYGQPYGQQPQSPYGYQAAQPAGYTYPAAGQDPAAGKGPAPREVLTGFWLILAAGVLTVIYLISAFLSSQDLITLESLTADEREMLAASGMTEETFSGIFVSTGIILSLIIFALYLLVAFPVRRGKNWARILGTVFAAFSAFGVLASLITGLAFSSPLELLSLVASLAGIAGMVMLYLAPSQPYFRSRPRFGPY